LQGPKAAETLTGLVTNDVLGLADGQGQYAAVLTPKGKIIADVTIYRVTDGLVIDVPPRAAAGFGETIKKYVNPRVVPYTDETGATCDVGAYGVRAAAIVAQAVGLTADALAALPPHGHLVAAGGIVSRVPTLGLDGFAVIAPADERDALWLVHERVLYGAGDRGAHSLSRACESASARAAHERRCAAAGDGAGRSCRQSCRRCALDRAVAAARRDCAGHASARGGGWGDDPCWRSAGDGDGAALSGRVRTALKEWSVLVDAMGRGELVAMVRKGGIREQRSGFAVRHEQFLLYPTYFHEKPAELAERFVPTLSGVVPPQEGIVRFRYVADVAAMWWVTDLDRLRAIESEVGLTWAAVESRFHYRNNPGVHVIALRVRELPGIVDVPDVPRYRGCVSWVALDHPLDVSNATPVLGETTLVERVDRLAAALGINNEAPR
jgi:hypothetical protein